MLRFPVLWFRLPAVERRLRAQRVLDRWTRRGVWRRWFPAQPSWSRLASAAKAPLPTLTSRMTGDDPRRGALFGPLQARAERICRELPEHADIILTGAAGLLERRFDLLGSGPCRPLCPDGRIDWHRDFVHGTAWDPTTHFSEVPIVRGDGSDIKVPWELSRGQHLLVLAQAFHLAPHRRPAAEADALRQRCADEIRAQILDWIRANPPSLGVNWASPLEIALRAFNWIFAVALTRGAPTVDEGFLREWVRSLWVHGRHLRRNLEIPEDAPATNHFVGNLVGLLAIACALPELKESGEWRAYAAAALETEIERQVGDDGVDYERSIPYHRLVTELFLHGALLLRHAGLEPTAAYIERLEKMLDFVAAYTRPDGGAPQWGDNDDGRLAPLDGYADPAPHDHRHLLAVGGALLGRADFFTAAGPRRAEALWLFDQTPTPAAVPPLVASRAFEQSGVHVLVGGGFHLLVGCGAVGTDGLGNHSHNDLLALDLWAAGRRWIADPGTGCYTADPSLRNRLRSVAAHATVQLGDLEPNPFDDGVHRLFRMLNVALPVRLEWSAGRDATRLAARHHAFGTHTREIELLHPPRLLSVVDRLDDGDPTAGPLRLRFPLAPGVEPRINASPPPSRLAHRLEQLARDETDRGRHHIDLCVDSVTGLHLGLDLPAEATVSVEPAPYSPRYGVVETTSVIVVTLPYRSGTRLVSVLMPAEEGPS